MFLKADVKVLALFLKNPLFYLTYCTTTFLILDLEPAVLVKPIS